jgi:hypothetical protein
MKGLICFSIALLSYFYYKVNTPMPLSQPMATKTAATKQTEKIVEKPTMVTIESLNAFEKASAWDRQKCIHEAGHFLMASLNDITVVELSIIESKKWGGYNQLKSRSSLDAHTDDLISAGGYAAEIVFISHEKTVFDYFYKQGINKHTIKDGHDLCEQVRNAPQEAYELVIEAAKILQGKRNQIYWIASTLYVKKILGEAECADLQAAILKN